MEDVLNDALSLGLTSDPSNATVVAVQPLLHIHAYRHSISNAVSSLLFFTAAPKVDPTEILFGAGNPIAISENVNALNSHPHAPPPMLQPL